MPLVPELLLGAAGENTCFSRINVEIVNNVNCG